MKTAYVYILASRPRGTIYIGVTSDLTRRVWLHKQRQIEGFTKKYGVDRLVYCEIGQDMYQAIRREKQLKFWKREWKIALIERGNPMWNDL